MNITLDKVIPEAMESRIMTQSDPTKSGEHSILDDRLRCSSSSTSSSKSTSSDFSVEDSYSLEMNKYGTSIAPTTKSDSSTLQTPTIQVMERPPNESGYRIPSSVFAKDKSSNPNPEWSTASNESLFSIHTGNMSFTRDQFSWLQKSSDLGMYGGQFDIPKSGELPPPSPRIVIKSGEQMTLAPRDTHISGEQIITNHFKARSATSPLGNSSTDIEENCTSKDNKFVDSQTLTIKTQKDDQKLEINEKKGGFSVSDEVRPSSVSPHSEASAQSFAFPVLAEIGKDKSVNSGQSRTKEKKSSTDGEGPKTPTSAPPPAISSSSWFSCCLRC